MFKRTTLSALLLALGVRAPAADPARILGVGKTNTALWNSIAKALRDIIDDRSYAALLTKWGLPTSSAISRATVNGAR